MSLKSAIHWCLLFCAFGLTSISEAADASAQLVDLKGKVPQPAEIREGLFPEEACEELKANGFKCMGFRPSVRFSVPAAHFELGSAVLPEALKRQLDVFAEVLKRKPEGSSKVLITGHADASGTPELNLNLSLSRAQATKEYLVKQGVPSANLITQGRGASDLFDASKPTSASNRRIEIGRAESSAR